MPAAINLNILYDRSQSIRDSVHDVEFALLLTIALVVMVIFLFLRNLSATIIPSLALPMSIVGTFAVMYLFGYTLDNLSLMALTLSVGFVVDDAIVILENIVRHLEMGEGTLEAALNGSKEIGFTIVSMTLSLAAVFIPVLFMGGICCVNLLSQSEWPFSYQDLFRLHSRQCYAVDFCSLLTRNDMADCTQPLSDSLMECFTFMTGASSAF